MEKCPCGLEQQFEQCCGPFIQGKNHPQTAEQLMRSRYSAFVKVDVDYIRDTHHPEKRSEVSPEETREWAEQSEWLGLDILGTEKGGPEDSEGEVEFVCKYIQNGKPVNHHERSQFVKQDGKWFFYDAAIVRPQVVREGPKVGRNDPCPCGSGKKYKKCCLA